MTYLKKIIFAAALAVSSQGFSAASNAALITQDIIFDNGFDPVGVIGEITVSVDDTGLGGLQDIFNFVSFSFMGVDVTETFVFEATVDSDDLFAGIEFLLFDVNASGFGYIGVFEASSLAVYNFVDVYTQPGFVFSDTGLISLGTAVVASEVSEPSTLALIALTLVGFGVRRKMK
tara:strand:- start:14565 stop:15089 length:525 start_codon:yes stop_codon:yes gene_type:complete